MARFNSIRWRKEDQQKLSRQVRKYNAKITREIKNGRLPMEFAPPRLKVSELRDSIQTRADFNRIINRTQRIFNPDALNTISLESGLTLTRYELREAKLSLAAVNRRRAAELKRLNPSTYKGTMGTIEENNLKPRKIDFSKIPVNRWGETIGALTKQTLDSYYVERQKLYKQNYLKSIYNIFGSNPLVDELAAIIQKIPAEELYDAYADDPFLQIDFVYDPLDAAMKLETLIERWNGLGYE